MALGDSLWLSMALVGFGGSWWLWWLLVALGGSWWLSVALGGSQWLSIALDGSRLLSAHPTKKVNIPKENFSFFQRFATNQAFFSKGAEKPRKLEHT